jgi:DNA-binding protein H-NS
MENSMARSLAEIQAEITKLKKEADKIRSVEVKEVVAKIRKAIAHYGLTPQELFGKGAGASAKADSGETQGTAARKGRVAKAGKGKAKPASKAPAVVRYKDEAGNTWVGRGKRPQWLRDALVAGKKLEDFAVK